jgi:phosphoenolpyruvate-protein kinase (PTS system EI component)
VGLCYKKDLEEREKKYSNLDNEYLSRKYKDVAFVKEKLIKILFNIKDLFLNE